MDVTKNSTELKSQKLDEIIVIKIQQKPRSCSKKLKLGRYNRIISSSSEESDDSRDEGTSQENTYPRSTSRDKNRKLISSSDEPKYTKIVAKRARRKNLKRRDLRDIKFSESDDSSDEGTPQGKTYRRIRFLSRYSRDRSYSSSRAEYKQTSKEISSRTGFGTSCIHSSTYENNARSKSRSSESSDDSSFNPDELRDVDPSCSNFSTNMKSKCTAYPGMNKIVEEAFTTKGISKESAKMMIKSLSDSTRQQYKKPLRAWWTFCKKKKISLYEFDSIAILDFLQLQLKNGRKYHRIRTCRAVLSLIMEDKPGKDPDIRRFVKALANEQVLNLNDNI